MLSKIKENWSAGNYGDIPIERVDEDSSESLDQNIRKNTGELKTTNFVEAAFVDKNTAPIGTEFDLKVDGLVVRVRVSGLHHSKYGFVDPSATIPPSSAGDPVPFNERTGLVGEIKDAIYEEKKYPDTSSDIDYTDLIIDDTPGPLSYEYGDYYHYEFRVVFTGFETL